MAHDYHNDLPGYDPTQLLVDGCEECEGRKAPADAIAHMDTGRFTRAWGRAATLLRDGLPGMSDVEYPTLRALSAVQVQLEHFGWPLGAVPRTNGLPITGAGGLLSLTKKGARFLATKHAWHCDNEAASDFGRTLLHSRAGGLGADWDLVKVIEFIDDADAVGFGPSPFGHDMWVEKGDRLVHFAVKAPRTTAEVDELRLAQAE